MAKVLVAEDDTEMRRLVVEALRRDGHDVTEAPDGGWLFVRLAEAFHHDPQFTELDCIVSDVRMPTCGGLELLERLVDICELVPVILMTAFGDDELRGRAETLGATLIEKSLSLESLRNAVWQRAGTRPRTQRVRNNANGR
jgi:two-component system cell cycle response regulator CpdR